MKTLFLIHGQLRTGKDEVGKYLSRLYESYRIPNRIVKFADSLKADCDKFYAPLLETINDALYSAIRAMPTEHPSLPKIRSLISTSENWYENKNAITRFLLQISGTEFARNADPDVWVKRFVEAVRSDDTNRIFICTDTRFENELYLEEHFSKGERLELKIIRIKVVRPSITTEASGVAGHASEQGLPDDMFDYVIDNSGTLEDLESSVMSVFASGITETAGLFGHK